MDCNYQRIMECFNCLGNENLDCFAVIPEFYFDDVLCVLVEEHKRNVEVDVCSLGRSCDIFLCTVDTMINSINEVRERNFYFGIYFENNTSDKRDGVDFKYFKNIGFGRGIFIDGLSLRMF